MEQHRPRLLGLAYRMLGDVHEAEDVVQEALARWYGSDRSAVASPEAWLVTVVTRVAIDRLRHLATERSAYVGPWLPEPISVEPPTDRRAELASELSIALLALLERLAPDERAAFILREVLGNDYADIARTLERSEAAVRQMVHRARERVRTPRARFVVPPDEAERLLTRFLEAMASEDRDEIMALVAPDVMYVSDGGGVVRSARRRVIGAERVTRLLIGIARKPHHRTDVHIPWQINGGPGYLVMQGDVLTTAVALDFGPEGVRGFYKVINPRKLRHLAERVRLRLE